MRSQPRAPEDWRSPGRWRADRPPFVAKRPGLRQSSGAFPRHHMCCALTNTPPAPTHRTAPRRSRAGRNSFPLSSEKPAAPENYSPAPWRASSPGRRRGAAPTRWRCAGSTARPALPPGDSGMVFVSCASHRKNRAENDGCEVQIRVIREIRGPFFPIRFVSLRRILKGFHHSAQGCEERATLGALR